MRSNALRGMQAMRGRAGMTGSPGRTARKAGYVKKAWLGRPYRSGKLEKARKDMAVQAAQGRTGQCRADRTEHVRACRHARQEGEVSSDQGRAVQYRLVRQTI